MNRPAWYRATPDTLSSPADNKVRRIRFDEGTVAWANVAASDGIGLQLCPLSCGCEPTKAPTMSHTSPTGHISTCDTCGDSDPSRDAALVVAWSELLPQCDLRSDDPPLPLDYIAGLAYELLQANHAHDLVAGEGRCGTETAAAPRDDPQRRRQGDDLYDVPGPDGIALGVRLSPDRTRAIVWRKETVHCPCAEHTVLVAADDSYTWEPLHDTPDADAEIPRPYSDGVVAPDAPRCDAHQDPLTVARYAIANLAGLRLDELLDTDTHKARTILAAATKAAWGRLAADSALFASADRDFHGDLLDEAYDLIRSQESVQAAETLAAWEPRHIGNKQWALTLRWSDGSGTAAGERHRAIPVPADIAVPLNESTRRLAAASVPL